MKTQKNVSRSAFRKLQAEVATLRQLVAALTLSERLGSVAARVAHLEAQASRRKAG